jgi:hypothetical protein
MLTLVATARVTVHFQAVAERFTPHDADLQISVTKELNETSLSAACSLHTASASVSSSSSSLRRRRLMEITEDSSEEGPAPPLKDGASAPTSPLEEHPSFVVTTPDSNTNGPGPSLNEEFGSKIYTDNVESDRPRPSFDAPSEYLPRASEDNRRTSTSSARASIRGLYDEFGMRKKVKLGPRPSVDGSRRPHTSSSTSRGFNSRPVSQLPPNVRLASRKSSLPSDAVVRPQTAGNVDPPQPFSTKEQVPPLPEEINGRPVSRAETVPARTPAMSSPTPKSATASREKARLMKAMELRKKKMSEPQSRLEIVTDNLQTPGTLEDGRRDSSLPSPAVLDSLATLTQMRDVESGTPVDSDVTGQSPSLHTRTGSEAPSEICLEVVKPNAEDAPETMDAPREAEAMHRISSHSLGAHESSSNSGQESQLDSSTVDDNEPLEVSALSSVGSADHELLAAEQEKDETDKFTEKEVSQGNKGEIGDSVPEPAEEIPLPSVDEPKVQHLKEEEIIPLSEESDVSESLPTAAEDSKSSDDDLTVLASSPERPADLDDSALTEDDSLIKEEGFGEEKSSAELEKHERRKGFLEPLQTDVETDQSDYQPTDASFDDDELESASIVEAKPARVARAPASPFTSQPSPYLNPEDQRPKTANRSVSNPSSKQNVSHKTRYSTSEMPVIETARSVSANFLKSARAKEAPLAVAKKVNVSSSISQRIKALQALTGDSPAGSPKSSPGASPAVPLRNTSLRTSPREVFELNRSNTVSNSPSPSPNPIEQTRTDMFSQPPRRNTVITPSKDSFGKPQRESISVITKIVRENDQPSATAFVESSDGRTPPLELHQSPLFVEHRRGSTNTSKESMDAPRPNPAPTPSPRPSSSSASTSRPKSTSSRRSSFGRNHENPRSPPPTSGSSSSASITADSEKKESKKSRLLRRMSNISSTSRKSFAHAISPTLKEETVVEPSPEPEAPAKPTILLEGWVNVQLPDTLVSPIDPKYHRCC